MNTFQNEVQDTITRILQIGTQWMGLQRTAGVILATIYTQECTSDDRLSAKDISDMTGLSQSTVSSICSHLEALGIIIGQTDDSHKGKGRRRIVFSLRVNIVELLQLGIKKNVHDVHRVYKDIEEIRNEHILEDITSQITLDRVAFEIAQFLSEANNMLKYASNSSEILGT